VTIPVANPDMPIAGSRGSAAPVEPGNPEPFWPSAVADYGAGSRGAPGGLQPSDRAPPTT